MGKTKHWEQLSDKEMLLPYNIELTANSLMKPTPSEVPSYKKVSSTHVLKQVITLSEYSLKIEPNGQ